MGHSIKVREMRDQDARVIARAFVAQGCDKPLSQYDGYYCDQSEGTRLILVAEVSGEFAGYLTVVWQSHYAPFRDAGIPEITDFNVLLAWRRIGIGTALMDEAERRVSGRSRVVGIGVGLTSDYGAAQVLYAKRGYVPDGRGMYRYENQVRPGATVPADDDLVLHLTKEVGR